jgi:hypothetical protein
MGLSFRTHDQILSLSFLQWQLLCCSSCRAPSLTRGRVCNLQCNRWLVRSLTIWPSHLRPWSPFVASYVEVAVNLRPTVSRPVCPGVRRPSGTRDQFCFLVEISFRQLRLCYFVAPSLTRGRVCNLLVQLLLGLTRAVTLGSKSRRTHGHISTPPAAT